MKQLSMTSEQVSLERKGKTYPNEVLLMTATINTGNTPAVAIKNSEERLMQYLQALVAWIKLTHVHTIIFCENSNTSYDFSRITEFAKNVGKTLEVIVFDGNQDSHKYGKGYGEGIIIKYALNNSKHLNNNTNFYKITGRLFVPEFDQIQKLHASAANVFKIPAWLATDDSWIDASQWSANESRLKTRLRFLKTFLLTGRKPHNYNHHVSTVFYKSNVNFFRKNLINSYQRVNDNRYYCLEHVFYEDVIKKDFTPFLINYSLLGRSGGHGKLLDCDYPEDVKDLAKTFI